MIKKLTPKRTTKLKAVNNTTKSKAKPSRWSEPYNDLFSFKTIYVREEFISQLAADLIQWALNEPRVATLNKFFWKKGIPGSTFYKWRAKYPALKLAVAEALRIIGDRREEAAIFKEWDFKSMQHEQWRYNSNWLETEEKRAKLKAEATAEVLKLIQEQTPKEIVVRQEQYVSTPLMEEFMSWKKNQSVNTEEDEIKKELT